jgi:hypothetical protein
MRVVTITAVLLAVVLTTAMPAVAQDKKPDKDAFELGDLVDIPMFFERMQDLEKLRVEARRLQINTHNLVSLIGEKDTDEKKLRANIQTNLLELRQIKRAHLEKVSPILKFEPSKLTDVQVLERLRDRSLGTVEWEDKRFRDAVAELEKATGVRILWNKTKVNQWNGVWLKLPDCSASCMLRFICHGFDLRWLVFEGDIYIFRKVDRNEDRWLRWEKKHGKIAGGYWRREEDELMQVVDGRRVPQTVRDMDIGLLRQNLLKFFVLEEESRLHQANLQKLKFVKQFVEDKQLEKPDPQMLKLAKKRERHIKHYLTLEREGCIEILYVIQRILGDRARLEGKDAEWRGLLETPISELNWRGIPLDQALLQLGEMVQVEVVPELPLTSVPSITLKIERGTLETTLAMMAEIHPMTHAYKNGKLYFFVE